LVAAAVPLVAAAVPLVAAAVPLVAAAWPLLLLRLALALAGVVPLLWVLAAAEILLVAAEDWALALAGVKSLPCLVGMPCRPWSLSVLACCLRWSESAPLALPWLHKMEWPCWESLQGGRQGGTCQAEVGALVVPQRQQKASAEWRQ
jgi:hypothetical protein